MITFPNCKINLGLNIIAKRPDGYHDIETIFYPLLVKDALEVVVAEKLRFTATGIPVPGRSEENLCVKAWQLLKNDFPLLPPASIHLHKVIPTGAGLGGGSSDAAQTLILLNEKFSLGISPEQLARYALQLGSDCAFFIYNRPCLASGRGEILQPIELDISPWSLVIVCPPLHVSTASAYANARPAPLRTSLKEIISLPITQWKDRLANDFEEPVFHEFPAIRQVKEKLYSSGALYSSLSGSGSAVFGIFPKNKIAGINFDTDYRVFHLN